MDLTPSMRLAPLVALGTIVVGLIGGAQVATVSGQSTLAPSTAPMDAHRAVVTRPADGGVDAVLVDADGRERVLRRVTPEGLGIDPRYTLSPYGSVSQQGWLELWAVPPDSPARSVLARYGLEVLVDLAEPSKAPIVVPSNGFMGGRFGPDGRWAHYREGQRPGGGAVSVFGPEVGASSEIIVPSVQVFGGGPTIIWAADGSGFLAREPGWGVTPLDGGPLVPGVPKVLSRWLGPTPLGADAPTGLTELDGPGVTTAVTYRGERIAVTPVAQQFSADGEAIWQLFEDTAGASPRTLLARHTLPIEVDSVRAIGIPAGPVIGFTLSPDDMFVAIQVGDFDNERFVLAPVTPGDMTVPAGPVIDGHLAGLVPASAADTWPSE